MTRKDYEQWLGPAWGEMRTILNELNRVVGSEPG
jgi:hypothetical protein